MKTVEPWYLAPDGSPRNFGEGREFSKQEQELIDSLYERVYEHMDNMLTSEGPDEPNKGAFSVDMVNSPAHYNSGNIETIDAIEESMSAEGFQDYCKGNVMKYIWRWRQKGGIEDLKKAQWYLNRCIMSVEKGGE